MNSRTQRHGTAIVKRGPAFREAVHDSYKSKRKPVSPTVCRVCNALYLDGRWQWAPAPEGARKSTCPACHRIHDDFPAGFITLKGEFLAQHHDEVLHLVRNTEAREKREHPLQRIMKTANQDGCMLVTTTDIHLARAVGDALHHAYRGKLDYHYNPEQNLLRVSWER